MTTPSRRRLSAEIWIVLALGVGSQILSSVFVYLRYLVETQSIGERTVTMHRSRDLPAWLDVSHQVLAIGLSLVPVALALYLLAQHPGRPFATLGLTRQRLGRSILDGLGLAALIGLPGIGVYLLGRELGITAEVVVSDLNAQWWTIPLLVLSAIRAGLVEEILVVGYLVTRLKHLTWVVPAIILTSAVVRASYHLYQGTGQAAGNLAMGLVFAYYYHRTGRLWPIVIAHIVIDIVAFVGYQYFAGALGLA